MRVWRISTPVCWRQYISSQLRSPCFSTVRHKFCTAGPRVLPLYLSRKSKQGERPFPLFVASTKLNLCTICEFVSNFESKERLGLIYVLKSWSVTFVMLFCDRLLAPPCGKIKYWERERERQRESRSGGAYRGTLIIIIINIIIIIIFFFLSC